ncbi:hypothetical protein SGRIM128S_01991 [Streptomyces griseomycini]
MKPKTPASYSGRRSFTLEGIAPPQKPASTCALGAATCCLIRRCSTVVVGGRERGSRFGCWKTIPMCSLRRAARPAGVSGPVLVPATTTSPESGVTRVAAAASRLDLPEPDGPTTAVCVPAGTSSETRSRAASRPSPSG